MVKVYRGVMQTQDYINNCVAANAYSSNSYPRQYARQQYDSDMPRTYYYPADGRRSAPYPPPQPKREPARRQEPLPSRRSYRSSYGSSSTNATPPSPPPPQPRRRKSVRFDDTVMTKIPQSRPKTFAADAPPVAISESAKQTSRRLYHRRPSDGGRPSARPSLARSESTRTMDTTRAEMGTFVGRKRESDRERERRYRDERSSKGRRR